MPGSLVDTHCHLDVEAYDLDRDEVVGRATEAGVARIVVPAVDLGSVARVTKLAERYDCVYAAVGIHPNDIPRDVPMAEVRRQLREAVSHPRVVAVGEIGLDYHWQTTPHHVQQEWLQMQLDLASELRLPVILHNREATPDMIAAIADWTRRGLPPELAERPGVLHSFLAGRDDARAALERGFYLGFTGPITYKKADEMRSVAEQAPLDRILVETDAPFLAPHPRRGERNEPTYVRHTAEKLAQVRQEELELVCRHTTANACRLFGWPVDRQECDSP